jgi:AcrR family transcriptional regulator
MDKLVTVSTIDMEKISLRSANKVRTAHVLREAALELFLEQGYDATKTEEVAEKAGVSVRTFFRYFKTKDEVLFKGQRSWSESFAEICRQQPASMSLMEAMCATLVQLFTGLDRKAAIRFEKVIETSVTLRGRAELQQRENADRMAAALAARKGLAKPDATCKLLGGVCMLLQRSAVEDWRHSRSKVFLEDMIVEKFQLLGKVYVGEAATSATQQSARK